jgi:hypothetical protein
MPSVLFTRFAPKKNALGPSKGTEDVIVRTAKGTPSFPYFLTSQRLTHVKKSPFDRLGRKDLIVLFLLGEKTPLSSLNKNIMPSPVPPVNHVKNFLMKAGT